SALVKGRGAARRGDPGVDCPGLVPDRTGSDRLPVRGEPRPERLPDLRSRRRALPPLRPDAGEDHARGANHRLLSPMSDLEPTTLAESDEQRFYWRKAFERAFIAHLFAYPLAFVTAC